MRCDVKIIYDARRSLDLAVQVEHAPDLAAQARDWFDRTWQELGCEPLRPSGKVLLLDRIMGVADALGYDLLLNDFGRAQVFARQAALAIGKPRITIDLPGQSVAY